MPEIYPSEKPDEYLALVSQQQLDDLSAAVREVYPNRLPGESFAEYVRRRPRPKAT